MVAAQAGGGHVADDVVDTLSREALAVVSRVRARLPSGGAFDHRLGGTRRVGGRWDRGVGGVAMELLAEIADLGFQVSDPLERSLQESPVSIALGTRGRGGVGSGAHGRRG